MDNNHGPLPRFSGQHKAEFKELLATGEVYAINCHPDHLEFGPWTIGCDLRDTDSAERLTGRFRSTVRKAAVCGGAPCRANLLDWWIARLSKKRRPYLQRLIQLSIELCEELESISLESPWKLNTPDGMPGLRRDQYPIDLYWLYTVPHEPLPDPKADFDFWEVHVWQGFEDLLNDLKRHGVLAPDRTVLDGRMRLPGETRLAFRNRTAARVSNRYDASKSGLQSLSFDLAVLLANYVVDRHLIGGDALAAFNAESLTQREKIEAGWKRSCRQLGLSWRKQLRQDKDGVDFSRPFRVVGADLALISGAQSGGTPRHIAESTPKEPPPTQSPNGAVADRREKETLKVVSESSLEEIQTAHSDNVPATASNAECERSENGNRAGSPEDWLQRFIQEHPGTTFADIKYSANIHTAEFQDWRHGRLKTDSVMSQRIEAVLSGATPLKKKPHKRRAE